MSQRIGHASTLNLNIGKWVSAKIYSDMKDGCACGCKDWKRVPVAELKGIDKPVCAKCGKDPELYLISAIIEDEAGKPDRARIRHTQEGERLKDIYDVVFTLRTVNKEMASNTFDAGKYLSKSSRDGYVFDKVVENYLAHHEKRELRGELTPGGLKDKKSLIKNHLLPFFTGVDVGHITDMTVSKFFESYTKNLRMRDRATSELKTILKFAMKNKKIRFIPEFPEIAAAEMVESDNFLTMEQQDLVISKIEEPVYRECIKALAIYGLRPCEIRTLKWEDVKDGVIYIRSHISLNKEIAGRKAQKNKGHKLPVVPEFEEVLEEMKKLLPRTINAKDYIFKGVQGGAIGGNVLTRAWNDACRLARIKGVTLYQGTKHSTLSDLGATHSDAKVAKVSGHTNVKTVRRYNQSNLHEVREMLISRRAR